MKSLSNEEFAGMKGTKRQLALYELLREVYDMLKKLTKEKK